jgi:hypothetical protein
MSYLQCGKVKVNVALFHAKKAYNGSGCVDPLIISFGLKRR